MVYGRYINIYIYNYSIHGVYKPTLTSLGGTILYIMHPLFVSENG